LTRFGRGKKMMADAKVMSRGTYRRNCYARPWRVAVPEKKSKLAVSSKVRFLRLQARRGGRSEKKLSLAGIAIDDILDF
jgi:hypothetical protein